MATVLNLGPVLAQTRREYTLFGLLSGVIFLLLCLIASGIIAFFLGPLEKIETGILHILDRHFDVRLNIHRDDELGDVAQAFDQMAVGLEERDEIAQFVSGALTADLTREETSLRQGYEAWGVVLASDIRNFTTLSEMYPPEQVVAFLNQHLETMSTAIMMHHGMIDKFIGDAVIAVFHGENRDYLVQQALATAREMMRQHENILQDRLEKGLFGYSMGVGIAGGNLLMGSFGASERQEFTVLGSPRHEAEKLEALSKKGQFTRIVVCSTLIDVLQRENLVSLSDSEHFEVMNL